MIKGILEVLMKEMADLTLPECRDSCRVPLNCCDELYCSIAKNYARRLYGITLEPTGHPLFPFMSDKGCVVAPHLRPLCTAHVCSIQSIGQKPNDANFNENYFQLRYRIDDLLYELDQEVNFSSNKQK